MNLRIFRTYSWQIDCSRSEMVMGGRNPMKLVSHDELQYAENYGSLSVVWKPVPVVEGEKPEYPETKLQRERFEKISEESFRIFEQLKQDGKLPLPLDELIKKG